jgi:hypothetical protein
LFKFYIINQFALFDISVIDSSTLTNVAVNPPSIVSVPLPSTVKLGVPAIFFTIIVALFETAVGRFTVNAPPVVVQRTICVPVVAVAV